MASVKSLARTAGLRAVLLVLLGTVVNDVEGRQGERSKMLLQVMGGSVSAEIKGAPLAEVARALERKLGARIHFSAPGMKSQVINARFEGLTPQAALQTLLEGTSYALVAPPAKEGEGMQIYLCAAPPPPAVDRDVAPRETRVEAGASDPEPENASHPAPDPSAEPPAPPDAADPDPADPSALSSYKVPSLPTVSGASPCSWRGWRIPMPLYAPPPSACYWRISVIWSRRKSCRKWP